MKFDNIYTVLWLVCVILLAVFIVSWAVYCIVEERKKQYSKLEDRVKELEDQLKNK